MISAINSVQKRSTKKHINFVLPIIKMSEKTLKLDSIKVINKIS